MLTTCSEPGCATLVMGGRCLDHERASTRIFVRGRPFAATPVTDATGHAVTKVATAPPVRSLELHDAGNRFGLPRD
jgi:hypothetical protein